MAKYDIKKELLSIHNRMYGTNFEQDRIIIEDAILIADTVEKIKDIIREEEHYEVSTNRPNKADYDAVSAEKFDRIWKTISEAEGKLSVR